MPLFDEKKRTLEGPSPYNADIYAYYNDSVREDVGCVRTKLEQWFHKYPESEKEDLKLRFKVAFNPTFFELYVYILFTELGYELVVHPELQGTLKKPDFLAKKGNDFFYIEVKYITLLSHDEKGHERRQNALLDSINKVDASNFLIKLEEIIFKDGTQPSGKKIIKYFNHLINPYNPDDYTESLLKNGFEGMPNIIYEDEQALIKVKLLPKSPNHRGTNSRSIASLPTEIKWGNDSENIIDALEGKATRYGTFTAPYIICLNKQSVSVDPIEVNEALYGSVQITWAEDPENKDEKLGFDGRGLFGSKHNPKFTRLSGVYFTNANTANLATTADHLFRHNPYAKNPIDLKMDKSIKELLSIEDNYPLKKLPNIGR